MRYALLVYNDAEALERRSEAERERTRSEIVAVLARPEVSGWLRLQEVDSATTLRHQQSRTLLTDGPFVDSKDYLGGLIVVEAEDLDRALAVAEELQRPRGSGAIEIRPLLEGELDGA